MVNGYEFNHTHYGLQTPNARHGWSWYLPHENAADDLYEFTAPGASAPFA
jgi:hypothetical protein